MNKKIKILETIGKYFVAMILYILGFAIADGTWWKELTLAIMVITAVHITE